MDQDQIDQIVAAAMLLGEPKPILCSFCKGRQLMRSIIGWKRCWQCSGTGFDYIGRGASGYAGFEQPTLSTRVDMQVKGMPLDAHETYYVVDFFQQEKKRERFEKQWAYVMRAVTTIEASILAGVVVYLAYNAITGV